MFASSKTLEGGNMAWFSKLVSLFGGEKSKQDLAAAYLAEREQSTDPWASFEVIGFEEGGRIKIRFNWNSAFIKQVRDLGFDAETDDDIVQLFFYTSSMRPIGLSADPQDDPVQPSAHPQLSSVTNEIRV